MAAAWALDCRAADLPQVSPTWSLARLLAHLLDLLVTEYWVAPLELVDLPVAQVQELVAIPDPYHPL